MQIDPTKRLDFKMSYKPSNLINFLRVNEKYDLKRKILWRDKHFGSTILFWN